MSITPRSIATILVVAGTFELIIRATIRGFDLSFWPVYLLAWAGVGVGEVIAYARKRTAA